MHLMNGCPEGAIDEKKMHSLLLFDAFKLINCLCANSVMDFQGHPTICYKNKSLFVYITCFMNE